MLNMTWVELEYTTETCIASAWDPVAAIIIVYILLLISVTFRGSQLDIRKFLW